MSYECKIKCMYCVCNVFPCYSRYSCLCLYNLFEWDYKLVWRQIDGRTFSKFFFLFYFRICLKQYVEWFVDCMLSILCSFFFSLWKMKNKFQLVVFLLYLYLFRQTVSTQITRVLLCGQWQIHSCLVVIFLFLMRYNRYNICI